jgi:Tol biopolymer transport system component
MDTSMRTALVGALALVCVTLCGVTLPAAAQQLVSAPPLIHEHEIHFADLRQITFGGENAEAYWSPDGSKLVFQSTRPGVACDQIFTVAVPGPGEAPGEPEMISSGRGRTTCAYYTFPAGDEILWATTEAGDAACPPTPDRSQGYVWPLYPDYDIVVSKPDGSDRRTLVEHPGYDAEATVCPLDGSIVFTSSRDGDLDLYRMDADGGNVTRLTDTPGYDGGAFFSPDCSRIVWRASRPEGEDLADFRRLLGQDLVRPSKLEIWVADADGSNARQVTHLGAASFGPSFFPSGDRIIFSTNHGDPYGREFDLWAIDTDGTDLERITFSPAFDGFPLFSPDGTHLVFASNRFNSAPNDTNVFVARWRDGEDSPGDAAADRVGRDVAWLADDERGGRGVGTAGIEASAVYIQQRFQELGLEPAGSAGYRQEFDVPVAVEREEGTRLVLDGREIHDDEFVPAGFSASGVVEAPVLSADYGIVTVSPEGDDLDDYRELDVAGKIVAVRRFVPDGMDDPDDQRRFSDLRHKAFLARERGAVGMIVVDQPWTTGEDGEEPEEAPLPRMTIESGSDAGIPVVIASREAAGELMTRHDLRAEIAVELVRKTARASNVVARLPAGADDKLPGVVVLGAHYDHLGMGGDSSLAPGVEEIHNGADDNASGTAALLEAARLLAERRSELRRDVIFAAFSGEESGLIGSTAYVREAPGGLAFEDASKDGGTPVVAMLNMDMVGRLGEELSVLGGGSAAEWEEIVVPLCGALDLDCTLGGDGYGPSDQTPFYAAGVPVLHFFTGTHDEYHKPSDDADLVDAAGTARVARLVADVAMGVGSRNERLTYRQVPAPPPTGDLRSWRASLGSIPDYTGDEEGRPGVKLAGVRPDGPADKAGLQRGDLLVGLAGQEVRDIYDMMFVLRQAKPGQQVDAVVLRGDDRLTLPVVLGESTGRR